MILRFRDEYTIMCDICSKVEEIDAAYKYAISEFSNIHIEQFCKDNTIGHLTYGVAALPYQYKIPPEVHDFWLCKDCTDKILGFINGKYELIPKGK